MSERQRIFPAVDLPQALALALCLIDFEIENPQVVPPPPGWCEELRQARKVIEQALKPQMPAPFFPPEEKRRGRRARKWASGAT